MPSFFVTSYIISLVISVISLIIGIYVGIKRLHTTKILPKGLRLYLITCCFPYLISTTLCSTYIAIFYLTNNTQVHFTIEIVRIVVSFSAQQIRNAFTMIVIERIIATVKLDKYTMSGKLALLWRLTIISYLTSAFYLAYTTYAKNFTDLPWMYSITNYYVYCAHMFMLGACAILYLMNRRMYKISAYRITLKKRYMIAQNIKSLSFLFPTILIYALFAQFGSMITIIFQTLGLPTPPVCIFHIFFNLSYLAIYFRHYCIHTENPTQVKHATTIKNPLGQNIPINVTSDQYFDGLQHQWK